MGTEGADNVRLKRFYHNVYGVFQLTEDWGLIAGFDYGTQQKTKASDDVNEVLSPVIIAQYKIADQWKVAGRVEYYQDRNGVIITTDMPNGFKTTGYSLNLDYAPVSNAVVRLEGKLYDSKDKIFIRNDKSVNQNAAITTSIAISF
ncbi:hypothetical protein D3C86_1755740 [compost metagenome]